MNDGGVILVGGFSEVIELCETCNQKIRGIIDINGDQDFSGYRYLGSDNNIQGIFAEYGQVPVVITPDAPALRMSLVEKYKNAGFKFATLIHPAAYISRSSVIGRGSIIKAGSYISSKADVGDFVLVNACAKIMHDCRVGDYSTIAPDAVLLGYVHTGRAAYIGANATVLPRITIGNNAVAGAGAVVTKGVADFMTVAGVPAKAIIK